MVVVVCVAPSIEVDAYSPTVAQTYSANAIYNSIGGRYYNAYVDPH